LKGEHGKRRGTGEDVKKDPCTRMGLTKKEEEIAYFNF
jgi:hypothetical protein